MIQTGCYNDLTRLLGFALLTLAPAAAFGQASAPATAATPATPRITIDCRNRSSSDQEVVVCGRLNGEDPYRIPKAFRKKADDQTDAGNARVIDAMGSGIPGAGSNIGSAGAATSSKGLYEQWLAEKKKEKEALEAPK